MYMSCNCFTIETACKNIEVVFGDEKISFALDFGKAEKAAEIAYVVGGRNKQSIQVLLQKFFLDIFDSVVHGVSVGAVVSFFVGLGVGVSFSF